MRAAAANIFLQTLLGGPAAAVTCQSAALEADAWEYVEYLAGVATTNPLPRDAKQVLFELLERLERTGRFAEVAAACPAVALTFLAQSLPYFEAQRGVGAMVAAAEDAAVLSRAVGTEGASSQVAWAASLLHVLRGSADAAACGVAGAPRVYVYETGELAEHPLTCSAGMEGVEVFFHQFFLASACLTRNPKEADLFYVPFYSFCYQNERIKPGNEMAELDRLHLQLVAGLEHFRGAARPRHLFLFPHEFWDFPSWRTQVADARLLVVEANPLEYPPGAPRVSPRHCFDCFSGHKDVVLPGHTDYWTTRQLDELRKPWLEREYSVCYHGAFAHPLYDDSQATAPFNTTAGATRAALATLRSYGAQVSVGDHLRPVRAYYERITDCQYCFVPKGVGFTNGRLMEAFFSGCIPVILSDAMVVPFDQFLPWPSFSLKLRMPETPAAARAAVEYVLSLPRDLGLQMHTALLEHRCWFDYGPTSRDTCSPFEGVLRVLAWQQRAQEPRRFWRSAAFNARVAGAASELPS